MRRLKTVRRPPIYPKTPGHLPCSSFTHPLPLSSRRPSVSFGGFGFSGLWEITRWVSLIPHFPDEPRGRVVIGKKATYLSRIREHHSW